MLLKFVHELQAVCFHVRSDVLVLERGREHVCRANYSFELI